MADPAVSDATAETGALPNSVTWNITGTRGKASISMSIFNSIASSSWQAQAEPRWQRVIDWMSA
jgi:hypothetical protein